LVFSPTAPISGLFFDGSRDLIGPFALALLDRYPVAGNQFHVGGVSNGSISSFTAALDHPELFLSITVMPGFPRDDDLAPIGHMKINMFAGETDTPWAAQMIRTNDALTALGADVFIEIVPGAGHTMPSLAGPGAARLFDLLP
jgi:predicted esterase